MTAAEKLTFAEEIQNRGGFIEAKQCCKDVLADTSDNSIIAKANLILGLGECRQERYTPALELLNESLQRYELTDDKENIAKVCTAIGIVFWNLSEFNQSLEYFQRSLALYEECNDTSGIARNLTHIGSVYGMLSDVMLELEFNQKALSMYQKIGSKDGIARNLSNIGIAYSTLQDSTRALEYYNQALSIFEELGRKDAVASILCNIGHEYKSQFNFSPALEYFLKALAINEELGRKYGIANVFGNIGIVHRYLLNFTEALEYYQKAYSIFQDIGNKDGLAIIVGAIGIVYSLDEFEGFDADKAEESLLHAIALCTEIGSKVFLYENHRSLSDLYKKQKRWEECQIHFEFFYDIEKEVLSEEAKKQAEHMEHRRKIEESERDRQVKLARFQEREKILDNILPSQITERLIKGEQPIADKAENVSVFFSDIVGFTTLSQKITAKELVSGLNDLFIQYDILAKKHGLEKIKTIGDAYMAVCGVPIAVEDHAERTANFALGVQELFANGIMIAGYTVNVRIGLHCGEVIAGVIGEQKFAYDLWGDAVNTAARMESHGEADKIHVSNDFVRHLQNRFSSTKNTTHGLTFEKRGEMDIKGKGMMKTYFLEKAIL